MFGSTSSINPNKKCKVDSERDSSTCVPVVPDDALQLILKRLDQASAVCAALVSRAWHEQTLAATRHAMTELFSFLIKNSKREHFPDIAEAAYENLLTKIKEIREVFVSNECNSVIQINNKRNDVLKLLVPILDKMDETGWYSLATHKDAPPAFIELSETRQNLENQFTNIKKQCNDQKGKYLNTQWMSAFEKLVKQSLQEGFGRMALSNAEWILNLISKGKIISLLNSLFVEKAYLTINSLLNIIWNMRHTIDVKSLGVNSIKEIFDHAAAEYADYNTSLSNATDPESLELVIRLTNYHKMAKVMAKLSCGHENAAPPEAIALIAAASKREKSIIYDEELKRQAQDLIRKELDQLLLMIDKPGEHNKSVSYFNCIDYFYKHLGDRVYLIAQKAIALAKEMAIDDIAQKIFHKEITWLMRKRHPLLYDDSKFKNLFANYLEWFFQKNPPGLVGDKEFKDYAEDYLNPPKNVNGF